MFNTRRPVFADMRVREALALLFDFEWVNRSIFFGLYRRGVSFFDGSELSARGRPAEGMQVVLFRLENGGRTELARLTTNRDGRTDRQILPAADFATVPSGASNKGPTSEDLRKAIEERRAKLGPEYEALIGTVRNVGYKAVRPSRKSGSAPQPADDQSDDDGGGAVDDAELTPANGTVL